MYPRGGAGPDCLLIVYRPYPPAAAAAAAGLSKLVSLNLGVDGLGRMVAGRGVEQRPPTIHYFPTVINAQPPLCTMISPL